MLKGKFNVLQPSLQMLSLQPKFFEKKGHVSEIQAFKVEVQYWTLGEFFSGHFPEGWLQVQVPTHVRTL